MTQHPFHHSDADRLNTLLDALVSRKRATDATASDLDAYAATHRLLAGDAADASATPSEDTLDDIWRTIMQMPTSASNTAEPMTPPISTPLSNRTRKLAHPITPNRFNTWLSAAIVAVILLSTSSAAWWLGPGGNGPSGDGRTRLAAITQDEATPEAIWPTPLAPKEAPWIAAITPDQCTTEPLSQSEYADALTTDPGPLDRSYDIAGPADPRDAESAVATVRKLEACVTADSPERARSHYTDAAIFYLGATTDNQAMWDQMTNTRMETSLRWSDWAEREDGYPLALVTGVAPQWESSVTSPLSLPVLGSSTPAPVQGVVPHWEFRYNPDDAYMLADGRMMVHGTVVYWAEDQMVQEYGLPAAPNVIVLAYILKNVDGQWLIDEQDIQLCFNELCNQRQDSVGTPVATPEGTSSLPAATYVHPHPAMCTADPLTVDEVMAMVTDELATPTASARVPVPEMNEATYEDLQSLLDQYLSCGIAGDPFRVWAISSPNAIRSQLTGASGPWMPEAHLRQMLEETQAEIDAAPNNSGAFNWDPAGNPAIPAMPDEYDPSLATIDDDGQARVTIVWVTRDGGPPSEEYGYPVGAEDGVSEMIFIWDASQGSWLIDGFATPGE